MMEEIEKMVGSMMDEQKVILVGSVDTEGFPNIKGIFQSRRRERIKVFYLTKNTSSMRATQFRENNRACIYCYDVESIQGVMLHGTMDVLTDSASKEMIWQEGDTMYYSIKKV